MFSATISGGYGQPQSILQSELWKDPSIWRFWSWCQLKAAERTTTVYVRYKPVTLLPGQLVFNRRADAQEIGLSEQTLKTCLKTLSIGDHPRLTVQTTRTYTIITLENSDGYEGEKTSANPRPTQSQPTPNPTPTQPTPGLPSESSPPIPRAYAPARNVVVNNNSQPTTTLPPELLMVALSKMVHCLSVRQPWASLLVAGMKTIENRGWRCAFRGLVVIHAGKAWGRDEQADYEELMQIAIDRHDTRRQDVLYEAQHQRGGFIGTVNMQTCIGEEDWFLSVGKHYDGWKEWFVGPFGFTMTEAREFEHMVPYKGQQGLFLVPRVHVQYLPQETVA